MHVSCKKKNSAETGLGFQGSLSHLATIYSNISKQLFVHQQCMQDFLGKSDPYLEFAKENPDGSFTTVHRTEVTSNGGL